VGLYLGQVYEVKGLRWSGLGLGERQRLDRRELEPNRD
jgi:hypothetical protein